MAYFIVIGTNNDVKCVVDEVKGAISSVLVSNTEDLYAG